MRWLPLYSAFVVSTDAHKEIGAGFYVLLHSKDTKNYWVGKVRTGEGDILVFTRRWVMNSTPKLFCSFCVGFFSLLCFSLI